MGCGRQNKFKPCCRGHNKLVLTLELEVLGDANRFHPSKGGWVGGGGTKRLMLFEEGGGGAKIVSDLRSSHFVAPPPPSP